MLSVRKILTVNYEQTNENLPKGVKLAYKEEPN